MDKLEKEREAFQRCKDLINYTLSDLKCNQYDYVKQLKSYSEKLKKNPKVKQLDFTFQTKLNDIIAEGIRNVKKLYEKLDFYEKEKGYKSIDSYTEYYSNEYLKLINDIYCSEFDFDKISKVLFKYYEDFESLNAKLEKYKTNIEKLESEIIGFAKHKLSYDKEHYDEQISYYTKCFTDLKEEYDKIYFYYMMTTSMLKNTYNWTDIRTFEYFE